MRARPRVSLHPHLAADRAPDGADPEAQAELVSRALLHLEQVQQMVQTMDDVPGGNRQQLLCELAAASDGLRQLYFIDAIY